MMGPIRITIFLGIYYLSGVVGAASLLPDDQYSPRQPSYRRDVVGEPLVYPNWRKYKQDLSTELEPPDYAPEVRTADASFYSKERMTRKDSVIRDVDIVPLGPEGLEGAGFADVMRKSNGSTTLNLSVPGNADSASALKEHDFARDDAFQDQGPGSVEVYKLDLHPDNSLLVPYANTKQALVGPRMKSKIPKKARADEMQWKSKPVGKSKTQLPSIFQQPPIVRKYSALHQKSSKKVQQNHKDEVFAIGGVPELQVGCEGIEASERQKRSSKPLVENVYDDWDNSAKYQDPVYRESTEPILLRVTPIVLDIQEEEPPAGQIYEEMDELLKLKRMESTSLRPTIRRSNRGDIDPVLEMDRHKKERIGIETFPERGDLGPKSNNSSSELERMITLQDSKRRGVEKKRSRRDTDQRDSPTLFGIDRKDNSDLPRPLSRTASLNHQSGRKLLWVQYTGRQEHQNRGPSRRHHETVNEHQEDPDLWGFGENDGDLSDDEEEEPDVDKLRQDEVQKRRREYERRKQQELSKRRDWAERGHEPDPDNLSPRGRDVNTEVERIRKEYERQLEEQQQERQRIMEERRRVGKDETETEQSRGWQKEESRRRWEDEQRKNRVPSHSRRREEEERRREWNRRREEEERRRILANQRNHEEPSPLTRRGPARAGDSNGRPRDTESEEQRLRDYVERNRPVNPKGTGIHRNFDDQSGNHEYGERKRYMEEHEKRKMEEERRRQQMEEYRRRQQQPNEAEKQRQIAENRRRQQQRDEDERRRQMEEHRRRQYEPNQDEDRRRVEEQRRQHQREQDEKRKQNKEQRRGDRPGSRIEEEERLRRLDEERKLQDYVRRNQPVIVSRRNNSLASNSSQERGLQEQRRTMEAARQWDHQRRPIERTNDGRMHGPSAPTNIGQRRYSPDDLEEMRRRHEQLEEERRREINRRLLEEEERRREAEYQRAESRRREEERKRLEAANRRDELNSRSQSEGRRNSWQDYGSSRHPTGEVPDQEAEDLRRREEAARTTGNTMRNREDEWRRAEERNRQQQQREGRERQRLENERNSRNNRHRRPHHEDNGSYPRQGGGSVRGGHDEAEWRRREHARLNSLPVSARIILRSDVPRNRGGTSSGVTSSPPLQPSIPSVGSRGNFDNDIDFPGPTVNRTRLNAGGFPGPAATRPPSKSPGACVWAIVQCCPANNRLTRCFESMGCPGVNWDPSPCRGSLADAARAQVVRFYESADEGDAGF